ncbi:hypothetical protein EVAR_91478_1 [Eumeta japonica]|uniref:Uncharacterized protein n=1 Tax=Eumeta variegata TaxID=151549 RepID=A0A4C1VCD1_EUMVA|nr:hypothetical protein EVAR_91478_1 [Eumeta japonica]
MLDRDQRYDQQIQRSDLLVNDVISAVRVRSAVRASRARARTRTDPSVNLRPYTWRRTRLVFLARHGLSASRSWQYSRIVVDLTSLFDGVPIAIRRFANSPDRDVDRGLSPILRYQCK